MPQKTFLITLKGLFVVGTLCLITSGCNEVERPDSPTCVINAPARATICYNLKTDYDDQGNLKPTAQPLVTQYPTTDAMITALNKGVFTTSAGWTNLKIYIRKLRSRNDQSLVDDGSADDAELNSVSVDVVK